MFDEEFLKKVMPSDTPEEAAHRIRESCKEIDDVIAKNNINAVDYMVYTCAMFDSLYGEDSVDVMEYCLKMMKMVRAVEGVIE